MPSVGLEAGRWYDVAIREYVLRRIAVSILILKDRHGSLARLRHNVVLGPRDGNFLPMRITANIAHVSILLLTRLSSLPRLRL